MKRGVVRALDLLTPIRLARELLRELVLTLCDGSSSFLLRLNRD